MARLVPLLFLCYVIGIVRCTERPVIGILAQENHRKDDSKVYRSFIAASTVKAVEASGARVVPILIDQPESYYKNLSVQLNGYIFPGGGANVLSNSGYARSAYLIYRLVINLNNAGYNVPILGICLGMEMLANLAADRDTRTNCSVVNEALTLKFLSEYRNSSLYGSASGNDIETLALTNSTLNNHRKCLTKNTLKHISDRTWKVLTTSKGANSQKFISSMEQKSFPIAAIIFHPEKNAYEWNSKQVNPHDSRSIAASRLFFDWLVAESRKNNLIYRSAENLMKDLIENYNVSFTGRSGHYYFQTYFLQKQEPQFHGFPNNYYSGR